MIVESMSVCCSNYWNNVHLSACLLCCRTHLSQFWQWPWRCFHLHLCSHVHLKTKFQFQFPNSIRRYFDCLTVVASTMPRCVFLSILRLIVRVFSIYSCTRCVRTTVRSSCDEFIFRCFLRCGTRNCDAGRIFDGRHLMITLCSLFIRLGRG